MTAFRFPIGLTFEKNIKVGKPLKSFTRHYMVTDHLTTTNSKGEVVKQEYEIGHELLGQWITETCCDVTIARNLSPEVFAKFSA